MKRACLLTAFASAIAINLAGCDRQSAPAPDPSDTATGSSSGMASARMDAGPLAHASDSDPASANSATPAPRAGTAGDATEAPLGGHDPARVIAAWSRAVEARDWSAVRSYWGDKGTRSGLSDTAFAARWSSLRVPRVVAGSGEQEGAAGSLYYTVPVIITDGSRVLKGEVVLRRVNDVSGASPEQLRWHIDTTTLTP